MSKRNMKKIIMEITTAAVAASMAVSNVIPVFAEHSGENGGSIVVDEGKIVLDTVDMDMLQKELDSLETELPDTSKQLYYGIARKSRLNSKGIIDYANGTVVIDSSDFGYLADEIDMLESAYKANMVSALHAMGTSFLADGSISHETANEGIPEEGAVRLSFDTIISGILQSQSVDHLAEQGIAGAVEDNLSKGTAAWVNGNLIIGSGADNDAYYKQGFIDGQLSLYDKVNISYVYHEHMGDSISGGECYTYVTPHHHNTSCYYYHGLWYHDYNCGSGKDGSCEGHPYGDLICGQAESDGGYALNCGKTTSTIESVTIVFNN